MEGIEESCDPNDTDWKQAPLITLMDAAKQGIPNAQKELAMRQAQMERDIAILSGNLNIKVTEIED